MHKAIFFDRDGVLNIDKDRALSFKDIEFYDGIADLIAFCREKSYKIFVVTNQPIIARGLITENDLINLHKDFQNFLLKENNNAVIDKFYYCPHHPNANILDYRKNCDCRKPKPGMILNGAKDFNIDLKNSYMVGDRPSDIIAGYLAGIKTVQCLSGKHTDSLIKTDLQLSEEILNLKPDYTIKNILELRDIIL